MKIWVDADACPAVIKEIIFRAAQRTKIETTLIANQNVKVPSSPYIKMYRVSAGFDQADNEIVERCNQDDLVITADIPLAYEVLNKGGMALNPRGELYSVATIKAKLGMRDFYETLRSSGIQTGGPASLSQTDRRNFANELDKILNRYLQKIAAK
ncbi:YaiI/YqxD family protein [Catenovulum sp. 2E275]|uniref:YaiI/YqxD family protein n=1 Tax=Catenovulum sp. 2E275 TaxID=2980497 RepID=UPI0021CE7D01|nr:YaiI/YqxD family protein [Catenovulum sp. 2E275]MCU4675770.1 YaiI/YqxD family protein [Catenovulum sp. 2E275]